MSEIRQMYLDAYYGKTFHEKALPGDKVTEEDEAHDFKQSYRKRKSGVKA